MRLVVDPGELTARSVDVRRAASSLQSAAAGLGRLDALPAAAGVAVLGEVLAQFTGTLSTALLGGATGASAYATEMVKAAAAYTTTDQAAIPNARSPHAF